MKNTLRIPCSLIFAEEGEDFQQYVYEDGTTVSSGTPIGVEITENDITKLYLLDGIFY